MPGSIGDAAADVPDWAALAIQSTDLLAALLGIVIAAIAYRGYRRNSSRPMLYISVGFILALGVPFGLAILALLVPGVPVWIAGLLTQAAELAGLGCILYALRVPG